MKILTCTAFALFMAPAAPGSAAEQAKALFDDAAIRYETSDYRGAVEAYTEAYRISFSIKDKELLGRVQAAIMFNLARAHSKAYVLDDSPEHLRQQIDLLEKYLDQTADLGDQIEAEELLEQARAELAYLDEQAREREQAVATTQAAPMPTNDGKPPSRGMEAAGYTLLGLGIASGGAAVTGVFLARDARSDFEAGPTLSDRNDATSQGELANVLIVAGAASAGALIVTGSILAAVGRKRRTRVNTSAWMAPGAAGLTVGGRF